LVAEKFTFSVVIGHQVIRNIEFFVADQQTNRINSNLAKQSLPLLRIGVPILRLKGPLVAEKSTFSVVKGHQATKNRDILLVEDQPTNKTIPNFAQKSLPTLRTSVPILRLIAGSDTRGDPSSKKSGFFSTGATRVLHNKSEPSMAYQAHLYLCKNNYPSQTCTMTDPSSVTSQDDRSTSSEQTQM
jgi:hypothetical protein